MSVTEEPSAGESTGAADDAGAPRPRARARGPVLAAVVGAMLFLGGVSGYLAMINPPFQQDESSHLGYTQSLREGTLPTVTTPVPTEGGGEELRLALARPFPFSEPELHVANNPPFPYIVGIPLAEATDLAGLPGGGLFGIRLLDLLGAVGAIGFAYLLGRELGGGRDLVGLVTAGLLSGLISISLVSSLANVDGVAFLATTAVTWALARVARTRTLGHALQLGAWCAVAAAVRPMSLAFAAVAGAIALGLCARTHGGRSLLPFGVRLAGPAAVLTGWFYALNVHRYGDPTGSSALFEKYGTPDGPSLLSLLWSPAPFVQTLDYLVTDVYGRDPWWLGTGPDKWAVTIISVGLVVAAVGLAVRGRGRGGEGGSRRAAGAAQLSAPAWISVAVLGVVPMLLTAQHMSGGGAGHPRYLMPVLPIVAAAAGLVLTRIHRWLGVAAVLVSVLVQISRVRAAGQIHLSDTPLFGPVLNTPLLGQPARLSSLALAGLGAALLLLGLVAVTRTADVAPDATPG